jgi:hypothetical protein
VIHYHGTPIGGPRQDVATFLRGRHALVSYFRPDDMAIVADVCASFVLDNGAFSVWTRGEKLDVGGYIEFCETWHRHPGLDWCLIPDVIDGDEDANDRLIASWPKHIRGAPVWHLHESPARLRRLCQEWSVVALGSSGDFKTPGSAIWWSRMEEVMPWACDPFGRPLARLHGLRMLSPKVFTRLPLASADSTNAAVNSGSLGRYGMYAPPTRAQRAAVIADRIEAHNSVPVWRSRIWQEAAQHRDDLTGAVKETVDALDLHMHAAERAGREDRVDHTGRRGPDGSRDRVRVASQAQEGALRSRAR